MIYIQQLKNSIVLNSWFFIKIGSFVQKNLISGREFQNSKDRNLFFEFRRFVKIRNISRSRPSRHVIEIELFHVKVNEVFDEDF